MSMINSQHISDSGVKDKWEMKFVSLDGNLTIRESPDDTIVRSTIHLYDIVDISRDETNDDGSVNLNKTNDIERLDESNGAIAGINLTTPTKYIIHIKMRYGSEWKFELASQEQYDEWDSVFQKNKGVITQRDVELAKPYVYKKEKLTFKTWYEDKRLFGGAWVIWAFLAYTCCLVVLFSVFYTQYVLPEKNIVEIPSQCYIVDTNAVYLWKRNYNLEIDVIYKLENGDQLQERMYQYCSGNQCPGFMDDSYVKGTTVECHYDEADPSYVFFDLSQMVRKRYTIVFGICGGLTAPWLIFVLVIGWVKKKKILILFKNSCCGYEDEFKEY